MYILSNGVKITEKMHQQLCRAIKDDRGKYVYFLDMETGKLIRISRSQRQKLATIKKKSKRFIPLPKVSKKERRERFVAFVEELDIIDEPKLKNRLIKEIRKGASLDKLEQILKNDPSGWIHGWVQDEHDLLAERIEEWITAPPLNAKDDPDYWYDDNCPVCQLMRKMEEENRSQTLEETHEAFKKAKEQGALVGGELFKDSLDREVDEVLEMAKSKKFEPGIYNFCDRWCEKCKDTDKCFLFAWEQKRKNRRLAEGKGIDEDFLGEVRHNFELVKRLIERSLNKQGLGLKKVLKEQGKEKHWDEDVKNRYNQVQSLILSKQYMQEVHKFLEDFHQNRFRFYSELGMEIDFSDIKDEIETISWYHTMLPVKIWRLLHEKETAEREKDKELKKLMIKDLDKYYGLVERCIQRSKIAWQSLRKKRKEFTSVSTQFINQLNKIKSELNK